MKKSKLAKITIILAIILVVLISFGGIYVQNQTNMENKVNEFTFGEELAGYREIVFSTEDETTSENVIKSKEIMVNRLNDVYAGEYKIYENTENGNILLQVPNNLDIDYVISSLVKKGEFKIIDTDTKEILLDSSNVSKAYTSYQTDTTGTIIFMVIEFNEEGTEKLKGISEKYALADNESDSTTETQENGENEEESETEEEEESAPTVSLTLDDTTIISTGFSEPITNGIIYVTVGSATTDQETLVTYVESSVQLTTVINNGIMPISYSLNSDTYISSSIMESDLIKVVCGIGIISTIALVYSIIKYKKIGLLTAIAFLGCIAIYLLIIRYTDVTITLNSICGIVLILILNYIFTLKIAKNIKSDDSIAVVKDMFKKQIIEFIMLLIPITILAVVTAFTALSSLGIVLFWGIIILVAYNFIITRFLVEK